MTLTNWVDLENDLISQKVTIWYASDLFQIFTQCAKRKTNIKIKKRTASIFKGDQQYFMKINRDVQVCITSAMIGLIIPIVFRMKILLVLSGLLVAVLGQNETTVEFDGPQQKSETMTRDLPADVLRGMLYRVF